MVKEVLYLDLFIAISGPVIFTSTWIKTLALRTTSKVAENVEKTS